MSKVCSMSRDLKSLAATARSAGTLSFREPVVAAAAAYMGMPPDFELAAHHDGSDAVLAGVMSACSRAQGLGGACAATTRRIVGSLHAEGLRGEPLVAATIMACAAACSAEGLAPIPRVARRTAPTGPRVKVVTYNIFARWRGVAGHEGQTERTAAIPGALAANPQTAGADAVVFQEVWCSNAQYLGTLTCGSLRTFEVLAAGMAASGWPHHTQVLASPRSLRNLFRKPLTGGVVIFSRWPITDTASYVFEAAAGPDAYTSKGAVFARCRAPGGAVNVIGTHLQSDEDSTAQAVRTAQLREITGSFVSSLDIPADELLVYAGDFNLMDANIGRAGAVMGASPLVPRRPSYDAAHNCLVGKDGSAGPAYRECFARGVPTQRGGRYCADCPPHKYDLVFCSNTHRQPRTASSSTVHLRALEELVYPLGWCSGAGCLLHTRTQGAPVRSRELSDHFPVVATLYM